MRFDIESARWLSGDDLASIVYRRHFEAYLNALDSCLRAARIGQLSPMWRYEDQMSRPNPLGAAAPSRHEGRAHVRAVKVAEVECLTCSDAIDFIPDVFSLGFCARLDVAAAPRQDWEPGVADGDWRRALLSWYQAALRVHEHRVEGLRYQSWDEDRDGKRAQLVVDRDLLEASYRAGLAVGEGADNGWREWLVERTRRWRDQGRAVAVRVMLLDFETPAGTKPIESRWDDVFRGVRTPSPLPSLPVGLPAYWTEPSGRAGL
ncbi:hypothetical protein [Mycolicibacterium cosmeticum]|uniref:hypothetical protein n=1 Tax=Mycolicibacterium cosmeticum TaxID=258533 RepID=UPI003204DEC4